MKNIFPEVFGSTLTLDVPKEFQPPPHRYLDYCGPWIENYFFNYWHYREQELLQNRLIKRVYMPIFWTDYYVKHGLNKKHDAIQKFIDQKLNLEQKYFTVVQNDDGILEQLPDNILIFSSGGRGHIPIPLIKGNPHAVHANRDILCSFMGRLDGASNRSGIRSKMFSLLRGRRGFLFGNGSMGNFIDVTSRSVFTLVLAAGDRPPFVYMNHLP